MKYLIVSLMILTSSLCYGQMRPLPAVICMADELDIHNRIPESPIPEVVKSDLALLQKINDINEVKDLYYNENLKLQTELRELSERRELEKKIIGTASLVLFASGNDTLKNIGLIGIFSWSIW